MYHLLRNRLYLGEITHKGTPYPGQHETIMTKDLWHRVSAKLDMQRSGTPSRGGYTRRDSLACQTLHAGSGLPQSPQPTRRSAMNFSRSENSNNPPGVVRLETVSIAIT